MRAGRWCVLAARPRADALRSSLCCAALAACAAGCSWAAAPESGAPPVVVDPARSPWSPCSGDTVETHGIRYASTSEKNDFDLYMPAHGGPCPLVIWVHGGAWQKDARLVGAPAAMVLRIVPRGYAVAAIRFRLSGDAPFPAEIHDVKAAVRYLHDHAAELGLDTARFAVWGVSSGAHLSSLLAFSEGSALLEDLTQGSPDASSHVDALIACYGPTFLPDMDAALRANGCPARLVYHDEPTSPESRFLGCTKGLQHDCPQAALADPVRYVASSGPPSLLSHGLADCTVPWEQTARLFDALSEAGVPSSFTKVAHSSHETSSCPEAAVIDEFLDASLE